MEKQKIKAALFFAVLFISDIIWATTLIPYRPLALPSKDRTIASDFFNLGRSLTIDITCEWSCKTDEKSHLEEVQSLFSSALLGLSDGNGNLLTPLSNTLKFWSEDICLNVAAKSCGNIGGINEFSVQNLSSGHWSAQALNFTCDESQEYIMSPFSKEFEHKTLHLPAPYWVPKKTLSGWEVPFEASPFSENAKSLSEDCEHPAKVTFCFGDCVYVEGKGDSEFLATPKPLGKSQKIICLDELAKSLRSKQLSSDVLQHACESYAFKILKLKKATGMTCSSSRLTTDCDSFISKLSKP